MGLLAWTIAYTDRKREPVALFVDLRKPMAPTLTKWKLPEHATDIALVKEDTQGIYLAYASATELGSPALIKEREVRAYAQPLKWQKGTWQWQKKIELPGTLLGIHKTQRGTYFLTADQHARPRSFADIGYLAAQGATRYTEALWRLHLSKRMEDNKTSLIHTLDLGQWALETMQLTQDVLTLSLRLNWFAQRERRKGLTTNDVTPRKREIKISSEGFLPEDRKP